MPACMPKQILRRAGVRNQANPLILNARGVAQPGSASALGWNFCQKITQLHQLPKPVFPIVNICNY